MKKLVLFGAFDRYNYGDNLMPVLFEMYLKKYRPEVLFEFEIVYASISSSDLSGYCSPKSLAMNDVCKVLPEGSAILVAGGEVLCARNSTLFLHTLKSVPLYLVFKFFYRVLNKVDRSVFVKLTKVMYGTKWEFPYIVDKASIPGSVKVVYNTVGGGLEGLNYKDKSVVVERIVSSDYFSVRDSRVLQQLQSFRDVALSPDSACIMSDLIDDDFLMSRVDLSRLNLPGKYYVFQASPYKVGASLDVVCEQIKLIFRKTGIKTVLLPIGYATGHDDYSYLKKIKARVGEEAIIFNDNTLWEIMLVIKRSVAFFGTSLHGVITALSYGVPHFGINKDTKKLQAFLSEWGVAPFNRCYRVDEMAALLDMVSQESAIGLVDVAAHNAQLVRDNNSAIADVLIR